MRQLNLLSPNLHVAPRLKAAMREAIRRSPLSRQQIIDQMNDAALLDGLGGGRGSTLSLANLDAWVAESKANIIPTGLLPLFCAVVGDLAPLSVLAAPLGAGVVGMDRLRILAWAEAEVEHRKLAKRKRKLLAEIEEAGNGER